MRTVKVGKAKETAVLTPNTNYILVFPYTCGHEITGVALNDRKKRSWTFILSVARNQQNFINHILQLSREAVSRGMESYNLSSTKQLF